MSGLEIVGVVVGIVPIVFKAAGAAWKTLDNTISFDEDTEDLGIRLETVKAHLGIWAGKSGVTQGQLLDALMPFEELIARTLRRVCDLVEEVEGEGQKYGIFVREVTPSDNRRRSETVIQISRSFHSVMASLKERAGVSTLLEREASMQRTGTESSVSRRVFWAIRERNRFENFVVSLERHVKGLQAFVVEGERKEIQQEGTRLALDTIGGLRDPRHLSQLQQASGWSQNFSQVDIHALSQWKAIALQRAQTIGSNGGDAENWGLAGSTTKDRSCTRFLKKGWFDPSITYLFEKKNYDSNISDEHKDLLRERVRQLISLLAGQYAQRYLHTLQPLGYVDDPDYHCWWIVFRFSIGPLGCGELKGNQPLSLRALYAVPSKPALESRYKLAKRLITTFVSLYGGDWMHKGINSTNIIFPCVNFGTSAEGFTSLHTALLQGFNYSRQLTQSQTIDQGKVLNDLEAAIYRHPHYQGEAASGYQIQYDIYSLGLVLFEIATWEPLMDTLSARPMKQSPKTLWRDMDYFHEPEAFELKRKVMIRVKYELAYRVGTSYKEAVEWCLNLEQPVTAVEFYTKVAIPLETLDREA